MSVKKWSILVGIVVILSMVLSACAAPAPQVVEKVVTQVVEQKVQVVQTQIVEKPVEKVEVCRCTACLMQGGGRLADGVAAGLRTGLGRVTPDGRIQLAWLATHLAGAAAPLVALDGEAQPEVTPANAIAWAQALAGEHPATRTIH